MSKIPLTPSGIPAAMLSATSVNYEEALHALCGDAHVSVNARANLTLVHSSSAPVNAFDLLYLSIGEGEALVTLGADIGTEVRVSDRISSPTFGDTIVDSTTHDIVGIYLREDAPSELEGLGALTLSTNPTNRSVVAAQTQLVTHGDVIVVQGVRRAVQSVIHSHAGLSIHLDRPIPGSTSHFPNWTYVRIASASAHTQLRIGEGTLDVTGNLAVYTSSGLHAHAMFPGDTVIIGTSSRTIQEVDGRMIRLDEPLLEPVSGVDFAWMPPHGHTVCHMLLRKTTLLSHGLHLRIGALNVHGSDGSYGALGSDYGMYAGAHKARFLDTKDVLHIRVRAGYRQILNGFPVASSQNVLNGAPPLVCVQSISAAANNAPPHFYHGFVIRVEPPQQHLTRFVNV